MARNAGGRWRGKLQPIFFAAAAANRRFEQDLKKLEEDRQRESEALDAKGAGTDERRAASERLQSRKDDRIVELSRELQAISERFGAVPYNSLPFGYLYTTEGELQDDDTTFARFLHWMRHQESLESNARRDIASDLTAWDDLHRTGRDFRLLQHQKGPIKPWKIDPVHRQLHELIMSYEIKPLTADERAECFDEFCPCGQPHDADALKKQYSRLKKDLAK